MTWPQLLFALGNLSILAGLFLPENSHAQTASSIIAAGEMVLFFIFALLEKDKP